MDPFTQKLLERTRARRELLQQKMSERPSPSKRLREPLTDANMRGGTLTPLTTQEPPRGKSNQVGASIPSPSKRLCAGDATLEGGSSPAPRSQSLDSRRVERLVKADTPAIASVRSRLRNLSQQIGDDEESSENWPGPVTPTRGPRARLDVRPSPVRRVGPAALAQRISSWEGHSASPPTTGGPLLPPPTQPHRAVGTTAHQETPLSLSSTSLPPPPLPSVPQPVPATMFRSSAAATAHVDVLLVAHSTKVVFPEAMTTETPPLAASADDRCENNLPAVLPGDYAPATGLSERQLRTQAALAKLSELREKDPAALRQHIQECSVGAAITELAGTDDEWRSAEDDGAPIFLHIASPPLKVTGQDDDQEVNPVERSDGGKEEVEGGGSDGVEETSCLPAIDRLPQGALVQDGQGSSSADDAVMSPALPTSPPPSVSLHQEEMRGAGMAEGKHTAEDTGLPYSVDAYRTQRRAAQPPKPPRSMPFLHGDQKPPPAAQHQWQQGQATKERVKLLNGEITSQQRIIQQASQALNCCVDEDHGKGSVEEAEAERLLLISTEKRLALLNELNDLKGQQAPGDGQQQPAWSDARTAPSKAEVCRGTVLVSNVCLPLKADFVCSLANKPDRCNYYFFVLFRHGSTDVVATPLASTLHSMDGDSLAFPTKFSLEDVQSDFEIDVEVYSLAQRRDGDPSDKRRRSTKSKVMTPKKLLTSITRNHPYSPAMSSAGGPNAVRVSNFSLVGSHKITRASLGASRFLLDKVPFLSPLEGPIFLKVECRAASAVEHHGFLTVFEDVGGLGAWHRRWFVLAGTRLSYWTYPDDERSKEALGQVGLAEVEEPRVGPASREACARPNTLELRTARAARPHDCQTLVRKRKDALLVSRYWLSADTKEERDLWMNKVNQVLLDLRTWQPRSSCKP
ncbi:anillin-like isoform X2 [Lampetra planeri]